MRKLLLQSAPIIGALTLGYGIGTAQPHQQQAYWYVSEFQVPVAQLDSLQRLLRLYQLPGVEEAKRAGELLDEKWLVHHTGSEYTVMMLQKLRSWDAVGRDTTIAAAFRRAHPDSARRQQLEAALNRILSSSSHRDGIYLEVTR